MPCQGETFMETTQTFDYAAVVPRLWHDSGGRMHNTYEAGQLWQLGVTVAFARSATAPHTVQHSKAPHPTLNYYAWDG